MLIIKKTVLPSSEQWEIIIEGMRNPMNSWDKMDSHGEMIEYDGMWLGLDADAFTIGDNDYKLMTQLAKGGPVHAKYRRMIPVWATINAPLYWWKEFDAYKIGTVTNSCSTMHKIHAKEFTMDDFSCEHLYSGKYGNIELLMETITCLNVARENFIYTKNKNDWWQMIQLLPSSYNQKRTVMLNYEVLCNIYHSRKNHKLDEWHVFCRWIENLPYSELITAPGGE